MGSPPGRPVDSTSIETTAVTRRATRVAATAAVWVNVAALLVYRGAGGRLTAVPAIQSWATVFVSLTLQALPFLVLGVLLSAAVSTLVPARWLTRVVPRRPMLAVPVAGMAGAVLPGCECSSVPVTGRLVSRGVPQAAALTFLLAAPAINPVVVVSTAVAFPGRPGMAVARFVASLATATIVGWLWVRFARPDLLEQRLADAAEHHSHRHAFADTAIADFLQAGGFLVLGAALVATLHVAAPPDLFDRFGGEGLLAVLILAGLAVVLSVCSEADAFVAAGLTQFSLTARLAFLVVGPMVDLKLIAMQAGAFGRRFTLHFAPLTFVVAVSVSLLVGRFLT